MRPDWAIFSLWATFKACGNNYFVQIAHIVGNVCKGNKIFHFQVKSFLGNFYRHLVTFSGHSGTRTLFHRSHSVVDFIKLFVVK